VNDLPCKNHKSKLSKSSKGNCIWCAVCRSNGYCHHVAGLSQQIMSRIPPEPRRLGFPLISRGSSATPGLQEQRSATSPVNSPRIRSSTSMSARAASTIAWAGEAQYQVGAQDDSMFDHMSTSMRCGSRESEVQCAALRHFPIGSVTPLQAKMALHKLGSTSKSITPAWELSEHSVSPEPRRPMTQ